MASKTDVDAKSQNLRQLPADNGQDKTITVNVEVLGKSYPMLCGEDERESLLRSAEHLNTRMKEVQETGNPITQDRDRVAITVAINLVYELLHASGELEQRHSSLQKRVDALADNISSVIKQIK